MLVASDRVLTESAEIVAWAAPSLYPPGLDEEIRALEAAFDDRVLAVSPEAADRAAPAVVPPEYGVALPRLAGLPEPMRGTVERWRAHPAGRRALKMYREERRPAA